jgi:hypothetical protein
MKAEQHIDERAMEEWRQLQGIVSRLVGSEYHIRGWLLVLLGALVAALFSERTRLTGLLFGGVGAVIVALFCWMELVVRVPKRRAIRRAELVEASLRGEREYDGPLLSRSMTRHGGASWEIMRDEVGIRQFWGFYVAVLFVVVVFAAVTP